MTSSSHDLPQLVVSRTAAESTLSTMIEQGRKLLEQPKQHVHDVLQLDRVVATWHTTNRERLRSMFDSPEVANEYSATIPPDDEPMLIIRYLEARLPRAVAFLEGVISRLDIYSRELPEVVKFAKLLNRSLELIAQHLAHSMWESSKTLYATIQPGTVPTPDDVFHPVATGLYILKEGYMVALPITRIEQVASLTSCLSWFHQEFERCIAYYLRLLRWDQERSESTQETYTEIAQRYNSLAGDLEQFQEEVGSSKHQLNRMPALADLEQEDAPPAGSGQTYGPGETYDFYHDVLKLLKSARTEVLVVDPYASEELFDLHLEKITKGVRIQILVQRPQGQFRSVAEKFCTDPKRQAETRSSNSIHDRHVFVDGRCFATGQSLKDAAAKKPTYLFEVSPQDGLVLKTHYDAIWKAANPYPPSAAAGASSP